MKKIIFLLAVCLIFGCQKDNISEQEQDTNIKNVTQYYYPAEMIGGELQYDNWIIKDVFDYDKNGNIIRMTGFDDNNNPDGYTIFEYDSNNQMIHGASYENEKQTFYYEATYENGKRKEWLVYSVSGLLGSWSEAFYNSNGEIEKIYEYGVDKSVIISETFYEYNESGLMIKETLYNIGDLAYIENYSYENFDSNGEWLTRTEHEEPENSYGVTKRVIEYY